MSTVFFSSCDGKKVKMERSVAEMSGTIKNMLEDMTDMKEDIIPLSNISEKILIKVFEYCEFHLKNTAPNEKWDEDFVKVDQTTLFELILAANFLEIKPLLEITCKTVANMIRGKTPDEIRTMFNIETIFTEEEADLIKIKKKE